MDLTVRLVLLNESNYKDITISNLEECNYFVTLYQCIGTKYIHIAIKDKVELLFKRFQEIYEETGNKVTVDLVFMKFVTNCRYLPLQFVNSINFIYNDEYDDGTGFILSHNNNVRGYLALIEEGSTFEYMDLPYQLDAKNIKDFFYKVKSNSHKIFRVPSRAESFNNTRIVPVLLAIAINCFDARIKVDFTSETALYFEIFNKYWQYNPSIKEDSYYILWEGNNFIKVFKDTIDGQEVFRVPGVKPLTEKELNTFYVCIPGSFDDYNYKERYKSLFFGVTDKLSAINNKKDKSIKGLLKCI